VVENENSLFARPFHESFIKEALEALGSPIWNRKTGLFFESIIQFLVTYV